VLEVGTIVPWWRRRRRGEPVARAASRAAGGRRKSGGRKFLLCDDERVDLVVIEVDAVEDDQQLVALGRSPARLLSILRQSIRRAQARDLVKRNVALLCDVPRGTARRPSKSLTLAQAADSIVAAHPRTPQRMRRHEANAAPPTATRRGSNTLDHRDRGARTTPRLT